MDKNRLALEAVIAETYTFTSPLDNALERESYFQVCWPNSKAMSAVKFVLGVEQGEFAWVVYEGTAGAKRFRNVELHRVRAGKIVSTEVYFGWNVPHPAPPGTHRDKQSQSA